MFAKVVKADDHQVSASTMQEGVGEEEVEEEEEESGEVVSGSVNEEASFDHFVVWGHECLAEDDDAFVKGAREWIAFAKAVSSERQFSWVAADLLTDHDADA